MIRNKNTKISISYYQLNDKILIEIWEVYPYIFLLCLKFYNTENLLFIALLFEQNNDDGCIAP